LLLFLSLPFLSYVFVIHSGWSWYPEQSNKENILMSVTDDHPIVRWALTGQRVFCGNDGSMMNEHIEMQPRDDLQLIGAQIFFRHGARTPCHILPGLEEVIYTKEHIESYPPTKWDIQLINKIGNEVVSNDKIKPAVEHVGDRTQPLKSSTDELVVTGQLTAVGEKQLFNLGRRLQSELMGDGTNNGLISNTYDPKSIYCRSTYIKRTLASARSFLAGLFSSETTGNKVQATGPFEIEVRNFPDEELSPNANIFPILNKRHGFESLYASLNDEHDLKMARQKILDYINASNSKLGIVQLHDDIISRQAHGFFVPEDLLLMSNDFHTMAAREYVLVNTNIGFDVFVRSKFGTVLKLIKQNFESVLKNYIADKENDQKTSYHKLFIYSCHDTTLIPMTMALGIFDMQWPSYAAHILMKYYVSKIEPTETYITVDYSGLHKQLPNCQDYFCPYLTFLKNLENQIEEPQP
jgi:lysophosphatidic acid phosphatase type 6